MWQNKLQLFVLTFVFVLIGIIPLLWFKPGYLAAGHDMGYSFNPAGRTISRLYSWSDSVNLGIDNTLNIGSLTFYLPETILYSLGFSNQLVQKIVFIFWFTLPAVSIFFLLKTIASLIELPERLKLPFFIIGIVFYSLNHYLLQAWFVASKQEISMVIMTPLLINFLLKVIFLKRNFLTLGIVGAFLLSFFNGGGANAIPIFAGLGLTMFCFFVYFTYFFLIKKNKNFDLKKGFEFIFVLGLFFVFLNSYWLLPFIIFISSNYSAQLKASGRISGISTWVDIVSKHSTFTNLLRLQGFSGWYDIEEHPYSAVFINNPIFIILSLLWLALFMTSLFFCRKTRNKKEAIIIGYFFLLGLMGLFFTSGSRSPFGFIYKLLLRIPGVAIIRSPFYKFGYSIWFAYTVLIAYSCTLIIDRLVRLFSKQNIKQILVKYFFLSLFILTICFYNYPFFTGVFFQWQKPFSTMTEIPSYVFEFQKWINKLDEETRILLYPNLPEDSLRTDDYLWNYYSLTPFPNLLSEKSIITNSLFNSNEDDQGSLIKQLYSAIKAKDKTLVRQLSEITNVKYLLYKKDMRNFSIKNWEEDLDFLTPVYYFGEWVVYKLSDNQTFIESKNKIDLITGENISGILASNPNNENVFIPLSSQSTSLINDSANSIIVAGECNRCDFGRLTNDFTNIYPSILPNSLFYKIKILKEKLKFLLTKDPYQTESLLIQSIVKRLKEMNLLFEQSKNLKDKSSQRKYIAESINQCSSSLDKLIALRLQQQQQEEINFIFNTLVLDTVENGLEPELEQNKGIISIFANLEMDLKNLELKIIELGRITKEKVWRTEDCEELAYLVSIPQEGDYQTLVKFNNNINYADVFETDLETKNLFFVDDNDYKTIKSQEAGIVNYGSYNYLQKSQRITLKLPPYKNLLKFSEISLIPYSQPYIIELDKFYQNQKYFFSFDYEKGSKRGLDIRVKVIMGNNEEKGIFLERLTKEDSESQNFTLFIPEGVKRIKIILDHKDDKSTLLTLKNLKLHPLLNPVLLLVSKTNNDQNTTDLQNIMPYKINPTFYEIKLADKNNNFPLIFKQGFSYNWNLYSFDNNKLPFRNCNNFLCSTLKQIYIAKTGVLVNEDSHFKSDTYSNVWFLDKNMKGVNKDLAIIYLPQLVVYLGFFISIFSLVLFSSTLIVLIVQENKKLLKKDE